MKKFNEFIKENISEITGYGNTSMEHNNVHLDDIYRALEEAIDLLDEL